MCFKRDFRHQNVCFMGLRDKRRHMRRDILMLKATFLLVYIKAILWRYTEPPPFLKTWESGILQEVSECVVGGAGRNKDLQLFRMTQKV